MNKVTYLIGFVLLYSLSVVEASAQSKVDKGYSVHNYKHPNKAKKANHAFTVSTQDHETAQLADKNNSKKHETNTPKYATRTRVAVVERESLNENVALNPLNSSSNYKTKNSTRLIEKRIEDDSQIAQGKN